MSECEKCSDKIKRSARCLKCDGKFCAFCINEHPCTPPKQEAVETEICLRCRGLKTIRDGWGNDIKCHDCFGEGRVRPLPTPAQEDSRPDTEAKIWFDHFHNTNRKDLSVDVGELRKFTAYALTLEAKLREAEKAQGDIEIMVVGVSKMNTTLTAKLGRLREAGTKAMMTLCIVSLTDQKEAIQKAWDIINDSHKALEDAV